MFGRLGRSGSFRRTIGASKHAVIGAAELFGAFKSLRASRRLITEALLGG